MIFILVFIGYLNLSMAADKIDMSAPPFWMSSYDEFKDLRADQKEFYLEKLQVSLKSIPGLEKTSKSKLEEAAEWYQTWNSIRRKLYQACQDKELVKECEQIADIRIQALDMYGNQKLENRHAQGLDLDVKAEETAPTKKKK
ncbi:hypothetical protein [Bdellovibrio reynosensis]|uniref:Uncharacterized protein n=1 Tax=Bdellovibrio reynosensis TaxID=2835041 RepID=A0ABY4C4J9_9BACT|nr:hypothetical protein [Bdellovibrio reynosensis]UOE99819.1 hypothetical protein MNR06_08935 [Bdellovibrio reynosensis]